MSTNLQDGSQPTVVLVHGAWADGSGWRGVYDLLRQDGHEVRVVQNPTVSLQEDVAATKMIIGEHSDPVVLVGHSYGGTVITEAGNHPDVAALVYIAGWVPDAGESQETLHESFAGDLSADEGAFMADSQVPWGLEALTGTISEAAWRSKPSWYLVTTEDRMIPPQHQRWMSERAGMTVEEAAGSHAIYVSRPDVVAALIEKAASEVSSAAR